MTQGDAAFIRIAQASAGCSLWGGIMRKMDSGTFCRFMNAKNQIAAR